MHEEDFFEQVPSGANEEEWNDSQRGTVGNEDAIAHVAQCDDQIRGCEELLQQGGKLSKIALAKLLEDYPDGVNVSLPPKLRYAIIEGLKGKGGKGRPKFVPGKSPIVTEEQNRICVDHFFGPSLHPAVKSFVALKKHGIGYKAAIKRVCEAQAIGRKNLERLITEAKKQGLITA